tara:strand:+ start:784 stop:993 length:210 start_codon:yes stop_codon:yes gene_type:complete
MINDAELKKSFNKSYGTAAPTREDWEALYSKDVKFIDPIYEKVGPVPFMGNFLRWLYKSFAWSFLISIY